MDTLSTYKVIRSPWCFLTNNKFHDKSHFIATVSHLGNLFWHSSNCCCVDETRTNVKIRRRNMGNWIATLLPNAREVPQLVYILLIASKHPHLRLCIGCWTDFQGCSIVTYAIMNKVSRFGTCVISLVRSS